MVYAGVYKDRPAVFVETPRLTACFLPEDGGKLASLIRRTDGCELLVTRPEPQYQVLTYDGSYVEAECSGFDDMFPTVDPYTPDAGPFAGLTYPDHGESCRIPYRVAWANENAILTADSPRFPIRYEKTVAAKADGSIAIAWRFVNRSSEPFPFLWAGHIMLQGDDSMRVRTPFSDTAPTESMFATKGFDPAGLPLDRLTGYAPDAGVAYKFYYLDPIPQGWFAVDYGSKGTLRFTYDAETLPYLGIWFNNGEFRRGYSITPEPCTVPFDAPDRAAKRGITSVVPANGEYVISMQLAIE